jgi:dUTPase
MIEKWRLKGSYRTDDYGFILSREDNQSFSMEPGERRMIYTGFSLVLPDGYIGLLSMLDNCGLFIVNNTVTHQDEVRLILVNGGRTKYFHPTGKEIARLHLVNYLKP